MTDLNDQEEVQPREESPVGGERAPVELPPPSEEEILTTKLAGLEAQVIQLKDQLLRKAAEFENYKKRTENETASIIRYANDDLVSKLLPVVDDFERSLKAARTKNADDALTKGIELIYTKLIKMLESIGVKPFEVVGTPFNPELHDALLQVPRADVAPHTVVEEVDKGYMLHDRVIRHARVIVSGPANGDQGK